MTMRLGESIAAALPTIGFAGGSPNNGAHAVAS
jgi:hypothetical protein